MCRNGFLLNFSNVIFYFFYKNECFKFRILWVNIFCIYILPEVPKQPSMCTQPSTNAHVHPLRIIKDAPKLPTRSPIYPPTMPQSPAHSKPGAYSQCFREGFGVSGFVLNLILFSCRLSFLVKNSFG